MWRLLLVSLIACGSSDPVEDSPDTFGGSRPATLEVPKDLDVAKTYPLLVVLHGYSANGFVQAAYFGVNGLPEAGEAFLIAPDGLTDSRGNQFWNADPQCCDFDGKGVDDSAYLGGMIDEILDARPEIDPARVYVLGHSNGGYMAYRLACDHADSIAAIGVLAGLAASTTCEPSRPVNVLHMHGTDDEAVPYSGAAPSVATWAGYNGCATTRHATGMVDYEARLDGAETTIEVEDGCPADAAIELWTIAAGSHLPTWNGAFEPAVWSWFGAHHR